MGAVREGCASVTLGGSGSCEACFTHSLADAPHGGGSCKSKCLAAWSDLHYLWFCARLVGLRSRRRHRFRLRARLKPRREFALMPTSCGVSVRVNIEADSINSAILGPDCNSRDGAVRPLGERSCPRDDPQGRTEMHDHPGASWFRASRSKPLVMPQQHD